MTEEEMCGSLFPIASEVCRRNFAGFTAKKCLGAGASAAVFHITDGHENFALKIYDPKFFSGEHQHVEQHRIELQLQLRDHGRDDLVKIYDAQLFDNTAFVQMEFIPWRSLDKEIGKIPPSSIRNIIKQISEAARFLDERRMTHRDIKPANIMVSQDYSRAKLLDLGVVKALDKADALLTDAAGELPFVATAQYSSPEYLFRIGNHDEDFWKGLTFYQLGGLLYDMIVGEPLFHKQASTKNKYVIAYAVLFETPTIPVDGVDPSLVRLARYALHKDLGERLKRVTWEDFSGVAVDESVVRARLGLNGGARGKVDRAQIEAIRIKMDAAASSIRTALMPLMRTYPDAPVSIVSHGHGERQLKLAFKPAIDGLEREVTLGIIVKLHLEDRSSAINISISASISQPEADTLLVREAENLWSGDVEATPSETAAIATLIERAILFIYDDAVSKIEDLN